MPLALNRRLLWLIVVWFALLQTIAPFIHAHLEADSPAQGYGLHMHDEAPLQFQDHGHTLKNVDFPTHTIGVDKALVKTIESLPSPLFAVLFIVSLLALTFRPFRHNSAAVRSFSFLHLKSLSRPRAPPLF